MTLNIRILQFNPIVGDISGNTEKLLTAYHDAVTAGCDLIVTSECFLSGYPPEDLVLRDDFHHELKLAYDKITAHTQGKHTHIILGTPVLCDKTQHIYNAALHIFNGQIGSVIHKKHLPNYGVFDECRIFTAGHLNAPIAVHGVSLGILICEDMWHDDVAKDLKNQNIDAFVSINASPFEIGKFEKRLFQAQSRTLDTNVPILTVFQMGGQDEIVFDGRSFALSVTGDITFLAKPYQHNIYDIHYNGAEFQGFVDKNDYSMQALIYNGLVQALRDYIRKNGFKKIVLGLSGGVDSVLSAVIAVDAVGANNVICLLLPSYYTSDESYQDAYDTISGLGITHHVISIEDSVAFVEKSLSHIFTGQKKDITEENLQSRMRGLYLMAYSNKFGAMLLTTGNKSEISTGYATLYGDMCGGFNVLKDVYKTEIYKLCAYRNTHYPDNVLGTKGIKIPENVLIKAPTAELRFNQKDSDSLPDYDILDAILEQMIEHERSTQDIIQMGFDKSTVQKVRHLLNISEHKRYQSALGVKITEKSFGKDRRYPITHSFRG